ncbi:molybdopterin converting factor subunit 1 [Sphingobium sp.]|uniref:molybdopterin converting factor subunit 1 n=1 Tax=Sphingobium sp. TaxID=1912891 RepID=UPI002C8A01CC|nr:molybdopterin converting factor subunit 1 [Sphingobium sp.]HUD94705.1 molybdopterin converting factor subunit 1 [Sphingobium sp.]
MKISIHYFSWIREAIGVDAESFDLPDTVIDVRGLAIWLQGRHEKYGILLGNKVRCAVDQSFAHTDAPLSTGSEVAFFPPVTGG